LVTRVHLYTEAAQAFHLQQIPVTVHFTWRKHIIAICTMFTFRFSC